jgi:hypothetical protein
MPSPVESTDWHAGLISNRHASRELTYEGFALAPTLDSLHPGWRAAIQYFFSATLTPLAGADCPFSL